MKSRVVPLRIPENLDDLAALNAREQHTDKAATLRQWLHRGATEYLLRLVSEGRLTLARAAELLDTSVFTLEHQARATGVELGASEEQRRQSSALAAKLAPPVAER